MATVIDALIVTLGLDASGYKKGLVDSQKETEKLRQGVQKAGQTADETNKRWTKGEKENYELRRKHHELQTKMFKEQEEQSKKLVSGLNAVKGELLGVMAAFTAGQGMKDFISNTIEGNAQIGRTARLLNTSVEALSSFQQAVHKAGGTPEGATQSLQSILALYTQLMTMGNADPQKLGFLRAAGLSTNDLKDPIDFMRKLAAAYPRLLASLGGDKGMVGVKLAQFGLDPGAIALVEKGTVGMNAALKDTAPLTQAQADAAEKAAEAWDDVVEQWKQVATELTTNLMPQIRELMGWLEKVVRWAHDNPETVKAVFEGIGVAVAALGVTIALFAAAAQPELLLVAGAAFALAFGVQDANRAAEGGKSAFDWGFAVPTINHLKGAFGNLWDVLGSINKAMDDFNKAIFNLIPKNVIEAAGAVIRTALLQPFNLLADVINEIADGLRVIGDLITHNPALQADFAKYLADQAQMDRDKIGVPDFDNSPAGAAARLPKDLSAEQQANARMIRAYAAQNGLNPDIMVASAYRESRLLSDPKESTDASGQPLSSARGVMQVLAKAHPGVNLLDPVVNARIALQGVKDAMAYLQKKVRGYHYTPGDEYLTLFLGPQGAANMLNADPNALAKNIDPSAAAKNPAYFGISKSNPNGRTAAQLHAYVDSLVTGAGAAPAVAAANSGDITNWRTSTATINGPININVPSGAPDQIAAGFHGAVQRQFALASQSATGLL